MIKYRTATTADARELLQTRYNAVMYNGRDIYPQEVLQAWVPKITAETIAAETRSLESADRITFVAEDCDENTKSKPKIVGLTTLVVSTSSVWQCYVLADYGGKGIGNRLMDMLEDKAREKGIKKLIISSSLMAFEFQKKRGFTPLNSYEYALGDGLSLTCYMMEKELG